MPTASDLPADRPGLAQVVEPRRRPVGGGEVSRVLPHRTRRMVGPFVYADRLGPDDLSPGRGIDVEAHPHIGLATVTYLFDGAVVHRDSTGAVRTIEPGAVNWMTAGRGVSHTERSPAPTRDTMRRIDGLQTWVALPAESEEDEPSFQHVPAEWAPLVSRARATIRVVAGTGFGTTADVETASPLLLADVTLDDAALPFTPEHPERAVLCVEGSVRVAGHTLPVDHLAVLDPDDTVEVTGTGRCMVLGGAPVGPRHISWNFVSSDPDRIRAASEDWAAGRFPTVPGDHDHPVPEPGVGTTTTGP